MRRSVVAALAAMLLVTLFSGGAVAARPVTPQISAVTAEWGLRTWDDGTVWCTLMSDVTLDPGFTKGQPVYAAATVHFKFVGDGDWTWQEWMYSYERLSRGSTTVHAYAGLGSSESPAVADWIRYDLISPGGAVLSTLQISTENTCPTG